MSVHPLVSKHVSLSLNVHYYHSLSAPLSIVGAPFRRSCITHTANTSYTISSEFGAWVKHTLTYTRGRVKGRWRGSLECHPDLLGTFCLAAKCIKEQFPNNSVKFSSYFTKRTERTSGFLEFIFKFPLCVTNKGNISPDLRSYLIWKYEFYQISRRNKNKPLFNNDIMCTSGLFVNESKITIFSLKIAVEFISKEINYTPSTFCSSKFQDAWKT